MTRPFPVPCSLAIAAGYVAGIASYATLPGPYLTAKLSPFTRLAIAFLLPTTGLVVCWLLAALWTRDPVRRGTGALLSGPLMHMVVGSSGLVTTGVFVLSYRRLAHG